MLQARVRCVAGNGGHGSTKLFGIDGELRQRSHPEQAGAVAGGDDHGEAGGQVAHLGCVRDVQVLDREWDVLLRQLPGDFFVVKMHAIKNCEVAPEGTRLALAFPDSRDNVGALCVFGNHDCFDRQILSVPAGFLGFFIARGNQR